MQHNENENTIVMTMFILVVHLMGNKTSILYISILFTKVTKEGDSSYMQIKFEDNKWVTRRSQSKKDRQYNDHDQKNKRTNSDLQNITQKSKAIQFSLQSTRNKLSSKC